MARYINMGGFTNPIGSVAPPTDPSEQIGDNIYEVRGSGGSTRHVAQLSPDNPYLENLLYANKNQDKDALYEMAVKWEAQRAQDEWQLGVNRSLLEQQRAYDDPAAVLARQRKAGINPDLAGASAGASSGSSSSMPYPAPASPDIQNTTKFSNAHDNTQQVLGTISTITQVVEAVGSLVGSFTLLPSQLRISNAQADLAEGTLDSAKSLARSQASAAELSALGDRIDFVGRLASFVQPDSDESTVRNLFSSLGVPAEQLDSVYGLYNHYKDSDAMQAEYNERQLRRKDSQAHNMAYTLELLKGIYTNEAEAKNLRSQSDFYVSQIHESINHMLAEPENIETASQTAKNLLDNSKQLSIIDADSLKLKGKQIKRDLEAFDKYLAYIRVTESLSKQHMFDILNGRKFDDLSKEDQALYFKEIARQWSLYSCGSDAVEQVSELMNSLVQDIYRRSKGYLADGSPMPSLLPTPSDFINAYFGQPGASSFTDIFEKLLTFATKKRPK